MTPRTVDCYFATVSPWAYLGHARFGRIVREAGAAMRIKPIDLGAVFPVSGGLPLGKRAPQRQAYRLVELRRYSQWLGVPLKPQPAHFPVDGNPAARLVIVADEAAGAEAALDLATRVGAAIWTEERDVADPAVLRALLAEAGLPGDLAARADDPAIAARYAAYTQEAIEAGVFGSPTYVIDGELFWGQDRLDFVERALKA